MGNFCATAVGVIGPGPINPLGSFCLAVTQFGILPGVVVD
jgi:hypothetical protein